LRAAGDAGFVVLRRHVLDGLDAEIIILQPPRGSTMAGALRLLRKLDPAGLYDFNHVYLDSGAESALPVAESVPQSSPDRARVVRVGLIDGGVATSHPALAGADVRTHGCDGDALPSDHGTAVASLLLDAIGGASRPDRRPQLYAADVYCGAPTGGAVESVVAALAWMLREQVPVVNVSLVGPPNRLLEHVIALVVSRGQTIVAAVGNDGPAAPPLYPASYPAVIAVTAVDRHHKVLLEAGRGTHVDFAAPGSDVSAAGLPDRTVAVRGTSFAAPIVAGLLARSIDRLDKPAADANVRALGEQALDLGAPGADPVYGHGLVGETPTAP
jgi:subtilisin family serine protease